MDFLGIYLSPVPCLEQAIIFSLCSHPEKLYKNMSVFSVQIRLIYLTDETFSAALPLLPAHSLVHFFSLGCLGSFIALILLLSYLPLSLTFTQIISLHGSLRGKYQRL